MNMVCHGQRVQVLMCSRKMRFRNKDFADVEVARIKAECKTWAPERLNSYRCPYCDGFHVGHVREGKKVYP